MSLLTEYKLWLQAFYQGFTVDHIMLGFLPDIWENEAVLKNIPRVCRGSAYLPLGALRFWGGKSVIVFCKGICFCYSELAQTGWSHRRDVVLGTYIWDTGTCT